MKCWYLYSCQLLHELFGRLLCGAYVAADPEVRFQFIMKYYLWGATIGSCWGC